MSAPLSAELPTPALSKAPVLLLTYRKPDCLAALHAALLNYAPPKLYIAHNFYAHSSEQAQVEAVRQVIQGWQFPFEVEYLLRGQHLTINDSITSAIDAVFAREERLIILEDDTLPSPSFFWFCNAMLARYQGGDSVGSVIGCNLGAAHEPGFFQAPFAIFYWGWATWATKWQRLKQAPLPWGSANGVSDKLQCGQHLFVPFLKKLDARLTWDVRWGWAQALNNQSCVLPCTNLVSNHGFVQQGSYTNFTESAFKHLAAYDAQPFVPAPPMSEARLQRAYEHQSADLLSEILQARGELSYYRS